MWRKQQEIWYTEVMRRGFIVSAIALFLFINSASVEAKAGEILSEPICFVLVNTATHKVYGSFRTDLYTAPDGTQARHTSNFRLEEAGAVDPKEGYPLDRAEFCSYGPFYEGRQLELILRTLFPVFTCKTSVEKGPIVIHSKPIEDDPMGGFRLSADCL